MNALRRRQIRKEAANRDRIAAEVANRVADIAPHLDGTCPDCPDEDVTYVNAIGRVVSTAPPTVGERFVGWMRAWL